MDRDYRGLIERQIRNALAEGQLTGLEGEGKPLPDRSGLAHVDMTTQVATRLLAEAGALPEKFQIKKFLEAAKATYRAVQTEEERHVAMSLIAELEQNYAVAEEARRKFMAPDICR